jgi:hypothetical protein
VPWQPARRSDAETLPAAALAANIRIAQAEGFIDALLHKVDLCAVDELETPFINDDLDAAVLENDIIVVYLVGIIDDIGKSVATGFLDADTQTDAAAAIVEIVPDPLGRRFCQGNCH